MTKKELLEHPIFKNMPDDTRLVYNTALKGEDCRSLIKQDLSYRSEIVGWAKKEINPETGVCDGGDYGEDPIYEHYLVIDSNPY